MIRPAALAALVAAALLAAPAGAQLGGTQADDLQEGNIVGTAVTLRTLDKVTAETSDFTVPVGDVLDYGSLSVAVRHCEVRPPEEIPETFVFLQIDDRRLDGRGRDAEPERVYSGWMLGSNPAKAALDHPVYDVWVIGCQTRES